MRNTSLVERSERMLCFRTTSESGAGGDANVGKSMNPKGGDLTPATTAGSCRSSGTSCSPDLAPQNAKRTQAMRGFDAITPHYCRPCTSAAPTRFTERDIGLDSQPLHPLTVLFITPPASLTRGEEVVSATSIQRFVPCSPERRGMATHGDLEGTRMTVLHRTFRPALAAQPERAPCPATGRMFTRALWPTA